MILQFTRPLEMSGLYIVYSKAGALVEKPGLFGTSHLMEHLVCHTVDVMEDRARMGGLFKNAFTYGDFVVFALSGLSSRLEPLAREYVGRLTGYGLYPGADGITVAQFENEKRTVMQEYKDAFAEIAHGHALNCLRKTYGLYHAIGLEDDIRRFSYDEFQDTYDKVFRHPAMIIYTGPRNIDLPDVECSTGDAIPGVPLEFNENRECPLETVASSERHPVECIGKVPCPVEDSLPLKFAIDMLTSGLQSPLYQEIRETRGLSYYSFGGVDRFGKLAIPSFDACTDDKGLNQLLDIYTNVFGHLEQYLTKERFEIVRSTFESRKEQYDVLRYDEYYDVITDRLGYCGSLAGLERVTYDKVIEVANKYIHRDMMYFYVG